MSSFEKSAVKTAGFYLYKIQYFMQKGSSYMFDKRRGPFDPKKQKLLVRGGMACACVIIVIVMISVGVHMSKSSAASEITKNKSENAQDISSDTGKKDSAKSEEEKQAEAEKKKAEEEEKARQEALAKDPRSDFAVQPGKTVGTLEKTEEKIVYLTFDDGPSGNTQKILDILDQYGCKATFFVTAEWPEYKDMIKIAYDKGHTIGLHSYTHDYSQVYSSEDAFFQDLNQIGQYVKDEIGYVPCFIRFPGGSSNTVSKKYTPGIMSSLAQDVQTQGYQYYDWNGDSGDGEEHKSVDQLVKSATGLKASNIIILCHDAQAKVNTVTALPRIIEYYQAQGYTFKAIDRSSFVSHHTINN